MVRPYDHGVDFERVGALLVDLYRLDRPLRSWLRPRWEYMHFHPMTAGLPLDRFGVAERAGEICGVVHSESNLAFNYIQHYGDDPEVVVDLLDWANRHLGGYSKTYERRVLGFYVDRADSLVARLLQERGFEPQSEHEEVHACLRSLSRLPEPVLPTGFGLQSLADDNDLAKINRVLWRGFNHPGDPPEEEIEGRRLAQQAPNFRHDLTVVASAPNGDYATFVGIWVVPENGVAYVEPVATDPDYRRLGLGRAAVLEGLRRAAREGAELAWVGSDLSFYLNMGFEVSSRSPLWIKSIG